MNNHDRAAARALETVYENRRNNLRELVLAYGGLNVIAKKMGYASGAYLSQVLAHPPVRHVSETMARKVESRLGLEFFCLDR